ncbi:hypothetical protein BDV26DRAFT_300007 [Aspergillus bertholletiae]|uniref:Uncharacterized protein n=1 Tax=Aspergillus bertholletiae TaxID=1226010 RepID=A0A5N7AYH2_9EURO|nr:hypothetical protein BDV26DRAFT_300007 [Aspergillus bertholletiae]
MTPTKSLWLDAYLAWIDAWLSTPRNDAHHEDSFMSISEMAAFFDEGSLLQMLDSHILGQIIISFRHQVDSKKVLLGGKVPPSCDETNILTHRYDPRNSCTCSGVYPVPPGCTFESMLQQNQCSAVMRMVEIAIVELVLSNEDEQGHPDTCLGPMPALADIQAPDRRPNLECDTEPSVYHQLYPTNEQVKLLTDAKYFFAIACGGGYCDEGLARAVAEAANDILIADYCEAADGKTLFLLQEVGAAATAFLKLCNLVGVITNWQFDNNVAQVIQFRALGYYRDPSVSRRPRGAYGSRMTGILSHRYIDLAIYYTLLSEASCYINDLIDFRSDIMRKLRENVILRGIRGNLCKYLDRLISACLRVSAKAIKSSPISALVLMGICNWSLMASQHKVYEVFHGARVRKDSSMCEYMSESDDSYQQLLEALAQFDTLGEHGPSVKKRRSDMDLLYHAQRTSPQTHTAWLADSTRSLLEPSNLRKIIDVVHFEWLGETGDVDYCP